MRKLEKTKDGGPKSHVDSYFLFEVKSLFSVALLRFDLGGRGVYHTHAFNAFTWFLWGDLTEEDIDGTVHHYSRSFLPKVTRRDKNHRVKANKVSWCFTVRGKWHDTWEEVDEGVKTVLTHGRVKV
tara:strand:+ start:1308 stop:1685 length:378 start_codon:yes stop_codon:yes gene_type:complete